MDSLQDTAKLRDAPPVPAGPWRRESAALLRLALPIILTGLADMAINATDIVMMGWLGPQALAAGILGGHFYAFLHFFALGTLAAVAPMIAQALGARQFRMVRRSVRQGLWVALTLALPGVVVILNARPILEVLGQSTALTPLTESYLDARVWGYLPGLWFLVLAHFCAAHSRPRAILCVTLVAIAVNALGNYGLMFGNFGLPRLELVGAGISSALVDGFAAMALLAFVLTDRRFRRYRVLGRIWRADWARYREIFRIGLPIAGTVLAEIGLFLGSSLLLGWLGEAQLAGHAVAIQCAAIAYMVPYGLGQAATVRVGLTAGAGDAAGAARAGWTALAWGCGFMVLPALVFWLWARPLVGLFLDLADPASRAALDFAVAFLGIAAVFQLVDGAQCIANGALRGLKDTRIPMLLACVSYWLVGYGAALVFGFQLGWGGVGVWVGLAFGLATAALALTWRFLDRLRALRPARLALSNPQTGV
ncbi:MAG: MATE family efflux transporter [Kiloniellales bacterium]|nr:MATE family efflux transporter [Kiloniellales bacterium]